MKNKKDNFYLGGEGRGRIIIIIIIMTQD